MYGDQLASASTPTTANPSSYLPAHCGSVIATSASAGRGPRGGYVGASLFGDP
jgi:hypothetical protein